ncbi:MAG: hypothetical protein ACI8R9_001905 [Paraglaciecola sp.]|jgi:hypothetical protein
MKFNKNLVLSSLTALVFSHNLMAQEFDLSADFISQHVETNISSMLTDIAKMHSSEDVFKQAVYQLNSDFSSATSSVESNADEDTHSTYQYRLTE